MYAVIEESGRQYKVSPGQAIDLDVRDLPEGTASLTLDKVLLLGEGADARLGTPLVAGAKVEVRLDGDVQGPKIHIFKHRRRKNYRRKTGHRQDYLRATVTEISDGARSWKVEVPEPPAAQEAAAEAPPDADAAGPQAPQT